MKLPLLYILLLFCCFTASGQDLIARVEVISPKIQSTNKQVFNTLETAMKDFINNHKWSADQILPKERIECNFLLNITSWDGSSNFNGDLQIQSSRPVFNTSYSSTLLNMDDKDITFSYTEGQPIDFTDQNFQSNLSSIMAFYCYVIVGLDYDSFSRYGGTPYFTAAQNVVINAQSSSYAGWKAFDGTTNRYWLSENLNSALYQPLRGFIYDYHRKGLDIMADDADKARKVITDILPVLSQTDRQRVGAMFPLVFFTTKSDELVSIFSRADPQERVQAMNILNQADPANGLKYQGLKYQ